MGGRSNGLRILPCLDSAELAEARRRELDIPHSLAVTMGATAVEATRRGYYVTPAGIRVSWGDQVTAAREATRSIRPQDPLPQPTNERKSETRIQVTNETTLGVARQLTEAGLRLLALNFANGIHPGGGFLDGALAQEETLCRSSALFATLEGDPMYDAHRLRELPDSSDWVILSPDVPVFRGADGRELDQPWLLSIITCAAPYAPAVGQPRAADLLQQRIHRVLAIARAYGFEALVLGAWGCGVFHNDPHRTARDFRSALAGEFRGAFSEVVFAVTDWSPGRRFLGPFRDAFAPLP